MAVATEKRISHNVQTTLGYYADSAAANHIEFMSGTVAQYRRKHDFHQVQIHDIRGQEAEFTVDKQGLQLCQHESREKDYEDEKIIKSVVYEEITRLLKDVTGATRVHPFSNITRRVPREVAEKMADDPSIGDDEKVENRGPAAYVHVDQSTDGAFFVLNSTFTPEEAETLSKTRWSIINVWRPLKPVLRDPLAVCDARTVKDEDLMPLFVKLPPTITKYKGFELFECRAKPEHKWYYASSMQPNEVLLLKIFDSTDDEDVAKRAPHCSFRIPDTENEATRESVEIRCLVFFEDQPVH